MKKIRLITASFGDDAKELSITSPLHYKDYVIDQVFYNNQNTKSRENSLHPRMKGKIPKMMEWFEHPDYDYYIWIDSKFTILENFIENLMQYENDQEADIFLFRHIARSSIKEEMIFMMDKMKNGDDYLLSRYQGEILEEQVSKYLAKKTFVDNHLFYGGCFMYTKRLVKNVNFNLMTDWLMHCLLYHTQDQVWLPYLLHKHKIRYKIYKQHLIFNNFLRYV